MKICKHCGKNLPDESFRLRKQGRRESSCLNCERVLSLENYHKRRSPELLERKREYMKKQWEIDPKGMAKKQRDRPGYNKKKGNKEKMKARYILDNAVRSGKIKKPSVCSQCGSALRVEAHHPNYAFPLKVIWLCRRCHRALDRLA